MKMPEATLVLVGNVFRVAPTIDFKTKEADGGAKIAILAVDGSGASEIKLNPLNFDLVRPVVGQRVAWLVQPLPWEMAQQGAEKRSGLAFVFEGVATEETANTLLESVAVLESASK